VARKRGKDWHLSAAGKEMEGFRMEHMGTKLRAEGVLPTCALAIGGDDGFVVLGRYQGQLGSTFIHFDNRSCSWVEPSSSSRQPHFSMNLFQARICSSFKR
jgi:hypothetical protein